MAPGEISGATPSTVADQSVNAAPQPNGCQVNGHAEAIPYIPALDADADNLSAATAYAAAGLYVLPVQRGTKNPGSVVGKHWPEQSSRDPKMLAAWFAGTDHGIALDVGRSGLVVIDVDTPGKMPPWLTSVLESSGTPYQSTRADIPGRGHHVFTQPSGRRIGCSTGRLAGTGLDVKGDGGVIIAQPTRHPEGGEYRWITSGPARVLPLPIAELLDDTGNRESAATGAEVAAFIAEHTAQSRPGIIHGHRKTFEESVAAGHSRHRAMVSALTFAMKEARAGFYSAQTAIDTLLPPFVAAKTRTPVNGETQLTLAQATAAFNGIRDWAIGQANAADVEQVKAVVAQRMPSNSLGTAETDFFRLSMNGESISAANESGWHTVDGATFVLDQPADIPVIWGDGKRVLWPEGEALMIAGGQGLGKTTLAGQLVRGLLGLDPVVLGLPITGSGELILYLAMDRPRQIAKSFARQFTGADREILRARVAVRPGPPHADLAKNPDLLLRMATDLGAGILIVDSLKDAAIGLSDDEVGAGYNRARQHVLNAGRQICDLHHVTKTSADTINDIYGSTWLTSGCGSVILLTGQPGDPVIGFRHVKPPMEEVGPFRLSHNQIRGQLTIEHEVDLVEMAGDRLADGLTARDAARALFDTDQPSRGEIEKARRKLDEHVSAGLLRRAEGTKGGPKGSGAAAWFPV